jgi:hypothetical protein
MENTFISEKHRAMLCASAINEGVLQRRGYRTVNIKEELKRLGFGRSQCLVPSLLIPIYAPTGQIVLYQTRPDQPRTLKGKTVKYETPSGSNMALDCHPSIRSLLGDPQVPLWVTEGVRKGDSLVSRDCCAIALLGVYNWRGTNDCGGKLALPAWDMIAST